MKETYIIKLIDLIGSPTAYGNDQGREIYQKILLELDEHPDKNIVGLSLDGITRTDASFPRESVISLAKSRIGEKGFYLQDFWSKDLMDNWDYAAKAKGQTIIVYTCDGFELIGNTISDGAKKLLDFVMKYKIVTTSKVAEAFDLSSQNASAKLKKLLSVGLILGKKQTADTGGMEYVYTAIQRN